MAPVLVSARVVLLDSTQNLAAINPMEITTTVSGKSSFYIGIDRDIQTDRQTVTQTKR